MKKRDEIYVLGKKLGLNTKDITSILTTSTSEKQYFSAGPPYHGSYYGTVSIEDF